MFTKITRRPTEVFLFCKYIPNQISYLSPASAASSIPLSTHCCALSCCASKAPTTQFTKRHTHSIPRKDPAAAATAWGGWSQQRRPRSPEPAAHASCSHIHTNTHARIIFDSQNSNSTRAMHHHHRVPPAEILVQRPQAAPSAAKGYPNPPRWQNSQSSLSPAERRQT